MKRIVWVSGIVARLAVCGLAAIVVACATPKPTFTATGPCPATEAERQFGCAPRANSAVTYQPDVVFIGGGADAVRSWSRDGLSWTLRGDADGVEGLAPGNVMVATGIVTGRVVSKHQDGSDVVVTLAPVGLGDVVKEGEISSKGPQPLTGAHFMIAPEFPGLQIEDGPVGKSDSPSDNHLLVSAPISPKPNAVLVSQVVQHNGTSSGFAEPAFDSLCCDDALGSRFTYDEGGLRVKGGIWLKLASPTIDYGLSFSNGVLKRGALAIRGITGVHVTFRASNDDFVDRIQHFWIPVYATIPVHFGQAADTDQPQPPPINIGIIQWVDIGANFQAKSGSLQATADYNFDVDNFQVSVRDGGLDAQGMVFPTSFTAVTKLGDTVAGASVGRAEVFVGAGAKICVCFGGLINSDGLFVTIIEEFDEVKVAGSLAILSGRCEAHEYNQYVRWGNGHWIPSLLAEGLNAALKPGEGPIDAFGGQLSDSLALWKLWESTPKGVHRCEQSRS